MDQIEGGLPCQWMDVTFASVDFWRLHVSNVWQYINGLDLFNYVSSTHMYKHMEMISSLKLAWLTLREAHLKTFHGGLG